MIALHPTDGPVLGAREASLIAGRWPSAVVAQYWGDVDRSVLAAVGLSYWPREAPPAERRKGLTERERDVLRGVFDGLANKEIADKLGISESSVKAALQQLFQKTGVRTRSQLVRVALERYGQEL